MRRIALACACLALAACATAPPPAAGPVAAPEAPATPSPPVATSEPRATPPPESAAPPAPAPEVERDLWHELAARMRFARCDDSAAVRRWIRVYAASPPRFAAMFARALPFLAYVQREVAARDLPGEFVLLPMVESSYVAFASRGNRPAGIWQFMPATARHYGLPIGTDYDARLDVAAATRAALDYLVDLGERFDRQWPLVNMAFNAGEYRVLGALQRARRSGKVVTNDQLALSPITHEHLAKLNALACIVRDPARWHVSLPAPASQPTLAALPLDAPTDLALLAVLARSDEADVVRFNPAARGARLPAGAIALLPEAGAARAAAAIAKVPRELRTGWRRVDARGNGWPALAGNGIDAALLAAVNGSSPDAPPPARVLVRSAAPTATARATAGDAVGGRYTVRTGDSLWTIARRFRVSVAALLQWNALPTRHVLRPGQLLWVQAPP